MGAAKKAAVFFDRDGTLNEEKNYLFQKEDWVWLPHARESLHTLKQAGYTLVVVTNQSGIARGYYTEESVRKLHTWVNEQLRADNAEIDAFYICPHHPDISGDCHCRKPHPGMLERAANDLGLDLSRSWMLGDKQSDIEAGTRAGCRSILMLTGYGIHAQKKLPASTPAATTLRDAVERIVRADMQER